MGANHTRVVSQLRSKLRHNAALLQLPIGLESGHKGAVDLIKMEAIYFDGLYGMNMMREEIPKEMLSECEEKRLELIEAVANVDEILGEIFLEEREPTEQELMAAIRRCTINRTFTPVLVGSALKNKGVQPLLDAVLDYLPNPSETDNYALDVENDEEKMLLSSARSDESPLLGLAFKLEAGKYGQLTYMRIYQGMLKRGSFIVNTRTGRRVKVPRLIQMHADQMQDIKEAYAGDICALFGVDCSSGDTFVADNAQKLSMESIYVPDPVISLAVEPKNRYSFALTTLLNEMPISGISTVKFHPFLPGNDIENFSKAVNRFTREDPTFRVRIDDESKETIISGMGELHLEIYTEVPFEKANPMILEPIMTVEISVPQEFQGGVMASINKRKGVITGTDATEDYATIFCEVPLNDMFGYSNELRSITQGKGEFTMEFVKYQQATPQLQAQLVDNFGSARQQQQQQRTKSKA
eukprot:gene2837-3280_t